MTAAKAVPTDAVRVIAWYMTSTSPFAIADRIAGELERHQGRAVGLEEGDEVPGSDANTADAAIAAGAATSFDVSNAAPKAPGNPYPGSERIGNRCDPSLRRGRAKAAAPAAPQPWGSSSL
jgi:hypothetical protein